MNTIYRLVWNNALRCFVVSSELSRARRKSGRTAGALAVLLASGGLCAGAGAAEVTAAAECEEREGNVLVLDSETGECKLARALKNARVLPAAEGVHEHIAMNTEGDAAGATGKGAMAFGGGAVAKGQNAIAFGNGAQAVPSNAMALGMGAKVTASGGIAIGRDALVAQDAAANAASGGVNGIAIGNGARVEMYESDSMKADAAIAIGHNAHASGEQSIALGAGSVADEDYTLSVGGPAYNRRIVGVEDGIGINDVATIGQLGSVAAALGGGATITNGVFEAPVYNVRDTDFNNVGSALEALDHAIDDIDPGAGGGGGGDNGLVDIAKGTITIGNEVQATTVSIAGKGGALRKLTGLENGKDDADAVNMAQLNSTNSSVEKAKEGVETLETHYSELNSGLEELKTTSAEQAGKLDGMQGELTEATKGIASLEGNVAGLMTDIGRHGERLDKVETRVTALEENGTPGPGNDLIEQTGTGPDAVIAIGHKVDGATISVAGTNGTARVVSGVADGVAMNDAANMSQLNATDNNVASLGGRIGTVETRMGSMAAEVGRLTSHFDLFTASVGALQSDVGVLRADLDDLSDRVDNLPGNPGQGDNGLVQQDGKGTISIGAGTTDTVLSVAGEENRVVRGVAAGTQDNDAVNVGQLKATGLVDEGGNVRTAVAYDVADDSRVGGSRITLAGADGTVIANLADGRVEAGSRDAVNGGQVAQIRDELEQDLAGLDDRLTVVEAGAPVAPGPAPEPEPGPGPSPQPGDGDYVSSQELQDRIEQAKEYTDGRFVELGDTIDTLRKDVDERFKKQDRRISRIGAMSSAMSQMTASMGGVRGENRIGAGVGTQGGEKALSVGYQRYVEKANASVTFGGAFAGGEAQVGMGVGFGW